MKKPPPRKTLADLKPGQLIDCLRCQQPKPAAGAVKFRAHHVCAVCAAQLKTLPTTTHRP